MKKMKKILALLLAMSMTVAMLAGCGAKEEAPAEAPAVEETVEAEAPAEETAEESLNELSFDEKNPCYLEDGTPLYKAVTQKELGKRRKDFERFPMLIKLIDAKNDLSIQVHPNDYYAKKMGAEYGKNEISNPLRTVTASVAVEGGIHPRLAVRTNRAVPKGKMFEIMNVLHSFKAYSPIKRGDVLIENVCNTGADIIASRDI